MIKRFISLVAVASLALSVSACTPDKEDLTPKPAPSLIVGGQAWNVDVSKVDISAVTKEFPDSSAPMDSLVDAALGTLAMSHLEDDVLYYEGWTEEDLQARYDALAPYLSPLLLKEADELLTTDFGGQEGMTLPLLPRVAQDGLVVNYDLNPYHTEDGKDIEFFIPQESIKTYVGTSEKRDDALASVEAIVVTVIPTKEDSQISFENRMVLHMIPVEGTWVLDAVNWFGDPEHVIPDEFKETLTEEEIEELKRQAEEEGAIILD